MRVDLSTRLSCTYAEAVRQVKTPRLLMQVASPLVTFRPLAPPAFPDEWRPGTYWVGLRLFGWLPFGRQAVVISFPPVESGFCVRDAGHSRLIAQWDHVITITEVDGQVRYRDTVEIRAGALTPVVWAFAQVFYRHRQRRWRALARHGFDDRAA
jgi:hypothetical protein